MTSKYLDKHNFSLFYFSVDDNRARVRGIIPIQAGVLV